MKGSRPRASGYSEAGASTSRRALKGFTARSGSPNEDINWNNYTLRQRGRMLFMSSPVATSAIKTNRTKIVGRGLTLKSTIDRETVGLLPETAKEWQKNTELEFRLWAGKRENCDAIGMNNFVGMQQLAVLSWLTNGDAFALIQRYNATPSNPYTLRLHMIEADRVSTPTGNGLRAGIGSWITDGANLDNGNKIYDGVEVDKSGMVQAYYICNAYPGQVTHEKIEWQRVSAFGGITGQPNVLHIMDSERADQYRGVTYLAPVIESLLNISRYTQSELMAALIQTFFTAWIETDTDKTEIPMNEVGYGEPDAPEPDSEISENENEYEMGQGTVLHLAKGEKIVFGNPNIPTQGFEGFFRVICKEIGAALEIPYDTLLKEFNASYSASRAALMEAWEGFQMRRQWLVDMFCQPVYEAWLAEAVAVGRIKAPGFFSDPRIRAAWCKARWIGPVQGQLDPTKEVKADIMAVAHGYKTHEQVTREYGGGDWEENVEQLARENEELAAANITAAADEADSYLQEPDAVEQQDQEANE